MVVYFSVTMVDTVVFSRSGLPVHYADESVEGQLQLVGSIVQDAESLGGPV